ncbi:hypothetical protein JOH48_008181 [Bradyrhizobium elkanii]|nr:hypothetical protein [Bradyrhizobium elkanii]
MRPSMIANSIVMRGLDPRIHPLRKDGFLARQIAGSSPAMTSHKFGETP